MKRRGREDFRERLAANQKSLDILAALTGKPRIIINMPPPRKKRAPKSHEFKLTENRPLESDIQKDIIKMLLAHPKVGLVERINSGAAMETSADGSTRYIKFNRIYAHGMRKVDLDCTLMDGRRMVIEVKRPPWKLPKDDREKEQAAYIAAINRLGGFGMFATSVESVLAALEKL